MSAEFRIVHFVSDPFLGTRIPVAAVLRESKNSVRVVRAQHLPGPECLGGAKFSASLRMLLDRLDKAPMFDRLPPTVGPFAMMASAQTVPEGIQDPAKWLGLHVLPRAVPDGETAHEREPKRPSVGYRFFEHWGIESYVKKQFKIAQQWKSLAKSQRDIPPGTVASLKVVSHWVEGSEKILLMEPLIPSRNTFEQDLKNVANNFSAFHFQLAQLELKKEVELIAYLLRSEDQARRDEAVIALQPAADQVVDLSNASSEKHFVREVKKVGESGASSLFI
jgi:hypothetical protein